MASSSSGYPQVKKYEVFITFRGADIRYGFLSHVVAALQRKQIKAITDDTELQRGNEITPTLLKVIEQSKISIVIFSKDYPNSPWCLDELEKILYCKEKCKQIVVPVFHQVDPSDIQQLRGNYAITNHSQQLPASKVENWKRALVEISQLSGFDSKNSLSEANLCDDIANDVDKKLSDLSTINSHKDGLFGIDSRMKDVELLIEPQANGVRMVGIWGMGGIGKTTLAGKVFNRIKNKFGGHSFVLNVREKLSKKLEIKDLRDQIICEVLGDKDIKIDSPCEIDDSIQRKLKDIKALIVLDDVDNCQQLKSLLEDSGLCNSGMFGSGSRIIVTSRDKQVLENVNMQKRIYHAEKLSDDEALQLFSWHAFHQCYPQEEYKELSEKVVHYCDGLPLALVVLGSELKGKRTREWEAALAEFSSIPHMDILKILRISFDGLGRNEKSIFLDIACFFKGDSVEDVERKLECFGFYARNGIDRLRDKSLITNCGGIIEMHDLVEQMGHEIVVEQSGKKHENQSRLWRYKDIKGVLTNNGGTENVEAISLNGREINDYGIEINSKAFLHMCKLRFLQVIHCNFTWNPVSLPQGLDFLPNSLRCLKWEAYPSSSLPSNFNLENLVELHMPYSLLEQLIWNKPLRNLKCICLNHSKCLTTISDLAKAPNLEVIQLVGTDLEELSSSICNLRSLMVLDISFCMKLNKLPEHLGNLQSLMKLKINENYLKNLDTSGGGLIELPSSISNLRSLQYLSVSGCWKLNKLPEHLGNLQSLERLDASRSGLKELPSSIQHLCKLEYIDLEGCKKLESLPYLPSNLESLNAANCTSLKSVSATFKFPKVCTDLSNCHKLIEGASLIVQQIPWEIKFLSADKRKWPGLCIVGSEVPQWMKYRNDSGSSLSLELDAHGSSIHVIFCVVVAPRGTKRSIFTKQFIYYLGASHIICAGLTDERGYTRRDNGFCFDSSKYEYCQFSGMKFNFKHIFLWCVRIGHNVRTASFSVSKQVRNRDFKIIKCGVHPIIVNRKRKHEEDEEETPQESNLDLNLYLGVSASQSS